MTKRKSIGTKLRFEVYKRDQFKCQYCGKAAPNVVLNIDHIKPVSAGGDNNILNLITSCFDCNSGKSNRSLSNHVVLDKQREQLELLQERRNQIELMFEWRNELKTLDTEVLEMVTLYIMDKIPTMSIKESGSKTIQKLIKKFELADILEAIDISADKYLQYDNDNKPTEESAENFFVKIGGILFNKNKSPVDQRLSYVKGICRNRFSYWNSQSGSIILNEYISALRNKNWSEERILSDINGEVIPKTINCRNWSEWKSLITDWTIDISNWETQQNMDPEEQTPPQISELNDWVEGIKNNISEVMPAVVYIGNSFSNFKKDDLEKRLQNAAYETLLKIKDYYNQPKEERKLKPSFTLLLRQGGILDLFTPIDNMLTFHLNDAVWHIFRNINDYFFEYEDFEIDIYEYAADRFLKICFNEK